MSSQHLLDIDNYNQEYSPHLVKAMSFCSFSSRGKDVERLMERLECDELPLTILYGQSGVGKSSLIQEGLIPTLENQGIKTYQVLTVLQQVYTDWNHNLCECFEGSLVKHW